MIRRTLTIEVCSLEEAVERTQAALAGSGEDSARYSFQTHAELLRTLTPNRWGLLEALTGAGPLGVRELARRVERDVKGVHSDAQALVLIGLIDKAGDGKLHFPYDAIHVDFMLKAA